MFCLCAIGILFGLIYVYYKHKYNFWKKKGITGPIPIPFLGNFASVIFVKEAPYNLYKHVYLKYPNEKLVGIYRGVEPVILVRDPEFIKNIIIKDFSVFPNRSYRSDNTPIFKNHLFNAHDEKWKFFRNLLTPAFTSQKLKEMIPIMQNKADNFVKYVNHIVDNNIEHELRFLFAKYSVQVIGACLFSLDIDTFSESESYFLTASKALNKPDDYNQLCISLDIIVPGLRKLFGRRYPTQRFFVNLVNNVLKQRQNGIRVTPSIRRDLMEILIELWKEGKVPQKYQNINLNIDEITIGGQALVFYIAGFETTSATMSFLIYELAQNMDIQNRLYNEINEVYQKCHGKLDMETMSEMKYFKMVLYETLRMYPVAGTIDRESKTTYTFPGTNVTIPENINVLISISGLNKDPKYYPNPTVFNPENFSPENIQKRPPYVFLPFGEGPRNCIGKRFAMLQLTTGIVAFVKNFKAEPMVMKPMVSEPRAFILRIRDGIKVVIKKRVE